MGSIRRRLAPLAALWLCCQLTLVASPIAVECASFCGPEAMEVPVPSPAGSDCVVKGVCVPFDMALVSLSTGDGVLPSTLVLQDQPLVTRLRETIVATLLRVAWPDVPPPSL